MKELGDGITVDSDGTIYYNGNRLIRTGWNTSGTIFSNFIGYSSSSDLAISNDDHSTTVSANHEVEIKDLIKEFLEKASGESKEYLDLITEFLRKRLELILDNPNLVNNLEILENIDKLGLVSKVGLLESEVEALESENKILKSRLDKLEQRVYEILDNPGELF